MTHDELLARIKEGQWVDRDEMHLRSNALRAIVELHKPIFEDAYDWCRACETVAYPCVTIQVIEKVLNDRGCNCCTDPNCCTCYCDDLEEES